MIGAAGCAIMTTTSVSLAIYFNYKVFVYLRQDGIQTKKRLMFRGIQKTMIVQLTSHCIMLSFTLIGLVIFSMLGIPYLLPFTAMMECGPTITTILTIISVPEYRKRMRFCFERLKKCSLI